MTYWNTENLALLPAFKAILERRGVSGAARVLGVSQSAVSKQLARLRVWLDDDLFVRSADGMQPTPRALELLPRVEAILAEASALTSAEPVSPTTFGGETVIATTDEIRTPLAPLLLDRIAGASPRLRLTFIPLDPAYSIRGLEAGRVDLVISVNWHAPDQLLQQRLFQDRFVCVMGRKHPLADGALTLEAFAAATHVMVAPLGMTHGVIDTALNRHGLARFVCLSVPDFALVTGDLLGDRRIATLPSRVADQLSKRDGVVVRELPLEAPKVDYYLLWHQRFDRDPRSLWIREQVAAAIAGHFN